MPLIRSCGNIPKQVEQEADSHAFPLDEGAYGDSQAPTNPGGRPKTRLQARREAMGQESTDDNRVRQIVNDTLREFREEVANMISEGFNGLSMANQRPGEQNWQQNRTEQINTERDDSRDRDDRSVGNRNNAGNCAFRNAHGSFNHNSERVLNLIRNWRIRFTGDTSEVTVEEFIYRVNTLTNANLKGDFNLLGEHVHILFEGKALKWFWRFHRSCDCMDWDDLCNALKRQFKDYTTDYDIKDDILRRKQGQNETFDNFYDAIMVLCDRLRTPLSEVELCEIIQRNLRPEVRHELLHFDISRVAQLRRSVRRHEKFVKDMTLSSFNKRSYQRTQVSEVIASEAQSDHENSLDQEAEVCVIVKTNKCWNCDNIGHTFVDC